MLYIIRYGELALKSHRTRIMFEKRLVQNIAAILERAGVKCEIRRVVGRIVLKTQRRVDVLLKRIFGIVSFSPCESCEPDIESIKKLAKRMAKKVIRPGQTFAVRTKRQKKVGPTSQRINEIVGEAVLEATAGKVRLKDPDHIIGIEIGDKAYVYVKRVAGPGGLPEGVAGKVLAIINRKQDLMAAWSVMRRGCHVRPVLKKGLNPNPCVRFFKKWSAFDVKYHRYEKIADIKKIAEIEGAHGIVVGDESFVWERVGLPVFRPLLPYRWLGKRIKV